jgi:hypothetical protein
LLADKFLARIDIVSKQGKEVNYMSAYSIAKMIRAALEGRGCVVDAFGFTVLLVTDTNGKEYEVTVRGPVSLQEEGEVPANSEDLIDNALAEGARAQFYLIRGGSDRMEQE